MPITSLPGANPHFPSTKLAFLCAFASKFFPMVVLSGSLQGTQCRVPRGAATLPHRLPLRFIPPAALRLRALPIHEGHGRPRSVRKSYRLREKCLFTELLLHEASSGRACWQRLTKTRTKKPHTKKPHTKKPCTRSRAQKSREQKKPCTKKTVHGEECARDGNRTRTDISAHRILSPACLPIPPLEQCKFRLEGQRYYFLSSYEPFLIYFCNLV